MARRGQPVRPVNYQAPNDSAQGPVAAPAGLGSPGGVRPRVRRPFFTPRVRR